MLLSRIGKYENGSFDSREARLVREPRNFVVGVSLGRFGQTHSCDASHAIATLESLINCSISRCFEENSENV